MHPLFRGTTILPVLTIEREADAVPLARALYEGGLRVIEITFRTEAAAASIAAIAGELPQVTVGAGTLLRAPMSPPRCTPGRNSWSAPA